MTTRTFESVTTLDDGALRELLAHGATVERVWAAWALGLRRGTAASAELTRVPAREPDAGVRRHVVVMLAAFGETPAVTALAVDDPDPWVRATACQYLVRLAVTAPALWTTIVARLSDAPVVRETIIQHLPKDVPAVVRAAAVAYVADPAREVRKAVIEQLSSLLPASGRVPRAIASRTIQEPDAQLRAQLMVWRLEREGHGPLLDQLATPEYAPLLFEALDVLRDGRVRLSWSDVAKLATMGVPRLGDRLLVAFKDRLDEVPLPWLLQHLAPRRYHDDLDDSLRWSLAAHLERVQPGDVPPEAREALARARDSISTWSKAWR